MFQTIDSKVQWAVGEIVEDFTEEYGLANALQAVQERGLIGCTAPQLLDLRLGCPYFEDPLWKNFFSTTSGYTK